MLITMTIFIAAVAGFLLGFRASNQRIPALISQMRIRTMHLLAESGDTLALILAEAEKRQATKAETVE